MKNIRCQPIKKIAHLHVWDQQNKGDAAIVLAVQELLRKNFPASRIIDFPVDFLKKDLSHERSGEKAAILKKINQADLVIIGGGGIFYSYFLPYDLDVIRAITKPVIIFGGGYIKEVDAADLNQEAIKSVSTLVKQACAVGVRDFKTKEFLVKNGACPGKIKVIGDPAALLVEKKPPRAVLKKLGLINSSLKSKPKIKIGFNLNYSGWLGFGKWHDDILRAYWEVADYFLKRYGSPGGPGVEFYYLKHHPGEKQIYPELKIKNLRVVDLEPADQKYVYGQLDLVIGMMLHAGVMAFGAGTPEISVAYDLRNYSFAEFIGQPELVIDLDKLKKEELLKRVKLVFKDRRLYRKKFAKIKEKINKEETRFLRQLI